jgi:parvulin-like peptidyl-prolyl isomerase
MVDLSGVSIESDEIVSFLQRNMQLKDVCQKILSQRIIEQTAQERGITVTPEEVEIEAFRLRYEQRLENLATTQAWLADQMSTVEDWEAGIRDRLLAQKLAESLFATEIENYFAQNRLNFEQIILYQIIVPYQRVARDILYQIEEREISFYEAAHLYDIDEIRRYQCGYEGKLYRWNLKPEIVDVVFNARPGELIGPITTEQGSHILIVEEFIPAQLTPQRYQEILNQMFKEWIDNQVGS